MLEDASIMITGGTGAFGNAFIGAVLRRRPDARRLVVYSRDEPKHQNFFKASMLIDGPGASDVARLGALVCHIPLLPLSRK